MIYFFTVGCLGFSEFFAKIINCAIIISCMHLWSDCFLRMHSLAMELLVGYGRELTHFLIRVATSISKPSRTCSKRGHLTCTEICLAMGSSVFNDTNSDHWWCLQCFWKSTSLFLCIFLFHPPNGCKVSVILILQMRVLRFTEAQPPQALCQGAGDPELRPRSARLQSP